MNDTLGYISREPVHRMYHHNEMTFAMVYACSEHFVLPISHDEVVHGKGSLVQQDARRPLAEGRQPARLPGLHVGPPRQAAAVHGLGVRPDARSGARSAASTGGCCEYQDHYGVQHCVRDLNARLPRDPGPVGPGQHARGLRVDRRERRLGQRVLVAAAAAATARCSPRITNFSAGRPRRLPRRPAEHRRLARGPQHRRRGLRRLRGRQLRRRAWPRSRRGTAGRRRRW